jgi:hypothetical protein
MTIPAHEQVMKELYGETAVKYGLQDNRRDGNLMAQGVDWRNDKQKPIESRESQV